MFFSKQVTYGIQVILYMAGNSSGKIFPAGDISAQLNLPKEFTSKILQILAQNKIIESKRGKGGGFYLLRKSEDLHLIEVINALDNKMNFDVCLFGFKTCSPENECPVHDTFLKLKSEFKFMLANDSLSKINNYKLMR